MNTENKEKPVQSNSQKKTGLHGTKNASKEWPNIRDTSAEQASKDRQNERAPTSGQPRDVSTADNTDEKYNSKKDLNAEYEE